MYSNFAPLLITLLLISPVICQPIEHAPRVESGNAATGAFGGDAPDKRVRWKVPSVGVASGSQTELSTREPTTEEPTTEEPTTEEPTTEEPTTEEPTTEEPTTEEPTTEEPTTEERTTEEPTTEEPTTEEPTTEKPTTEEPTTEEPTTEEPTTEKPTTEEPTTEEPTTEEPTTEEPTTEPPTTTEEPATKVIETEEPITEEPITEKPTEATTEKVTTEPPTTEKDFTVEFTTEKVTERTTEQPTAGPTVTKDTVETTTEVDPNGVRRLGNADSEALPDGTLIRDLGKEYKVYPGLNDWSRIVANEQGVYVLHPVQKEGEIEMFNPFTIGQILGYIYERAEFGDKKPPGGKYTIELMGKSVPSPVKRSLYQGKTRRATLVFIKKSNL